MTPGRRALLGIADSAIAEVTGKDPNTVRHWKAGTRNPDVVSRAQLAAAFGIDATREAWGIIPKRKGAHATGPEPHVLVVPTPTAERLRKAGVDALQLLADALDAIERKDPAT